MFCWPKFNQNGFIKKTDFLVDNYSVGYIRKWDSIKQQNTFLFRMKIRNDLQTFVVS